ncbi:protein kinase [Synechococcales cyanobacterium C]|uniref:non-specific serine/threonine protein kinase n=1 Tax=Petrachloros mirabilis ULC683 TaxID=2781853 RepID=A0A8K2A290_9CYAN|nr:protein kinase [Petrachloros mirabilis]NCJ08517.1 protein kinase [Petrachloros mirabilis ULC683]
MVELGKLFFKLPTVVIPALSTPYFPVGSSLQQGKYYLNRVLSRNRGIVTYQATHGYLARPVIVKTVGASPHQSLDGVSGVQRLSDQAQVIAKLHHPHLAHLDDLFVESGLPCLVFAFAEGMTAAQWMKHQRLSTSQATQCVQQLGSALTHLHQQGFVHGALSPEHVVIDLSQDWATLVGVGLDCPRPIAHKTLGSVPFSAEEKMEGSRPLALPTTDVYGLAAILYGLVTGQSAVALMRQLQWSQTKVDASLSEILERQPDLASELVPALASGLNRRARQRPATIADWLALLPDVTVNRDWQATAPGVLDPSLTLPVKTESTVLVPEVERQPDADLSKLSRSQAAVTPFPNTYRRSRTAQFPGRALAISALLAAIVGLGLGLVARVQFARSWAGFEMPLNSAQKELPLKQESFAPRRTTPSTPSRFSIPPNEMPEQTSPSPWDPDLQEWAVPSSETPPYEFEDRSGDRDLSNLTPEPTLKAPRGSYDAERDPWLDRPVDSAPSGVMNDPWEAYEAPSHSEEVPEDWSDSL